MTTEESWRAIPGYEDAYAISSHGRVRSLDRITVDSLGRKHPAAGRVLRTDRRRGSECVTLWRNNQRQCWSVARLQDLAWRTAA
jgi:hypothetical protein